MIERITDQPSKFVNTEIYPEEIAAKVKGECTCGEPLPLPGEILRGTRDYNCPKCHKDNTPPDEYEIF